MVLLSCILDILEQSFGKCFINISVSWLALQDFEQLFFIVTAISRVACIRGWGGWWERVGIQRQGKLSIRTIWIVLAMNLHGQKNLL